MENSRRKFVLNTIMAGVMSAGMSVGVAGVADAGGPKWEGKEKCYGVAKAGMNDCGNAQHNCAGKAKKDRQGDEWIWVPEGTCEKIAGGSTSPKK